MRVHVSVQTADFDLTSACAELRAGQGGVGAVVAFVGTVRDQLGEVAALELEHYPGMTEKALQEIVDVAAARFDMLGATVIHRVGRLNALDQIVLVAVASAHRGQAFQACEFIMDYLKTQAPFWKKSHGTDGASAWVDARACDDQALERWGIASGQLAQASQGSGTEGAAS